MFPTFSIILRKDCPKKNGDCPIVLQVIYKRRNSTISLQIYTKPAQWDKIERRLLGHTLNTDKINYYLQGELARAQDIALQFYIKKQDFDLATFRKLFKNAQRDDLLSFMEEMIKLAITERKGSGYVKSMMVVKNKIEAYQPEVKFYEITREWLMKWRAWLDGTGVTATTANKNLSILRLFMKQVKTAGLIVENPFDTFKLSSKPSYQGKLKYDPNVNKELDTTDSVEIAPDIFQYSKTKRDINLRLRFLVMKRDNFKCVVCGRSPAKDPEIELHIDHIIAWANGGETVFENLQTLCSLCNIGKSDLDFSE